MGVDGDTNLPGYLLDDILLAGEGRGVDKHEEQKLPPMICQFSKISCTPYSVQCMCDPWNLQQNVSVIEMGVVQAGRLID